MTTKFSAAVSLVLRRGFIRIIEHILQGVLGILTVFVDVTGDRTEIVLRSSVKGVDFGVVR